MLGQPGQGVQQPLEAASGLVTADGSSIKRDYDAVEEWLYDATAPLMAEFSARFDPTMDDSNDPLGVGYWATFQMVSSWRENAWRNAEALVSAPTEANRAAVAATIEAEANAVAEGLLHARPTAPPFTSTVARDAFCAATRARRPRWPTTSGTPTRGGSPTDQTGSDARPATSSRLRARTLKR